MYSKIIIAVLFVLLLAVSGAGYLVFKNKGFYIDVGMGTPATSPVPTQTEQPENPPTPTPVPHEKADINEQVTIPLLDANNETAGNIELKLTTYEFSNEVIVKGITAKAIEGREFLLVTIEITNNYNNAVEIKTKDYIQLSIDSGDWLNPDIHNDPVAIEPFSTKLTRVGFPINTTDENFSLKLGNKDTEAKIIKL